MFVDGALFSMRIADSVDKEPVLAAIGVAETGHRTVLGLQAGDKESASNWYELFTDQMKRGLDSNPKNEKDMDLHNNQKGIEIGRINSNTSDGELAMKCLNASFIGELKGLKP